MIKMCFVVVFVVLADKLLDPAGATERVYDSGCAGLVGCFHFVPLGQPCLLPDPRPVLVPLRLDALDNSAGGCGWMELL